MILSGAIQDETINFNGKNWTQVSQMRLIKIYPFKEKWIGINSDGGLYYSEDNGHTWKFKTGNDNAQAISIAIAENFAIAATKTGLKQTTDGITWNDITDSLIKGTNCTAIAVGKDGIWVTSNKNGNYYTADIDGFANWKQVGLAEPSKSFIKQVYGRWFLNNYFDLGINGLDGTGNSIYGQNWSLISAAGTGSSVVDCFYIDRIGFIIIMPGILSIGSLDGLNSTTSKYQIANHYKWSNTTIAEFSKMNSAIVKNADNIFIITDSNIINLSIPTLQRTTMLNIGGKKLYCKNNRYYAGTSEGIYYFNEKTSIWSKAKGIASEVYDINCQNNILMAATYSGIYISEIKEVNL